MSGTIGIPPWNPETTKQNTASSSWVQPNTLQAVENLLQWEKLLIENDGKLSVIIPNGVDLEAFRRQLISELDTIFQSDQHIPNIQIDTILSILYEDMISWNGDISETIGDTPRILTETEHRNYEGFFADLNINPETRIATWLYTQRRDINVGKESWFIQDLLFKALWKNGIHFGFIPVDSTTLKENGTKIVAQPQESTPWNPGGFMPSENSFDIRAWLTLTGENTESNIIGRFVRVGTVVGTWIPAEAWIPGRDIFGNIIPLETITEPPEPTLWNIKRVEKDEKISYIAEISGQFMMKWNHIEVRKERIFQDGFNQHMAERLWPLSGDITVLWEVSAGITTDGEVHVRNATSKWGNVTNANINTEASCTIEWSVLGSVHVESTREGIQKGYKGVIEARGDIAVGKWIEKAYIWSREGKIEIKWWAIGSIICGEKILITGNVRNCIIVGSDIEIYENAENCTIIGQKTTVPAKSENIILWRIRLSDDPSIIAYPIYLKYLQQRILEILNETVPDTKNKRLPERIRTYNALLGKWENILAWYLKILQQLIEAHNEKSLSPKIFDSIDVFLQKNEKGDPPFSFEHMKTMATYQKSVENDTQVSREYTQYDLVVPDIWEFLSIFQNPRILGSISGLQQYFQQYLPTNPKPKMLEGVTVIQKSPTHS